MPASRKTRKRTAFVPRALFANRVLVAGVVPLCVTACGGESDGRTGPVNVADVSFGVANVGFDARVVDAAFHRDANVGLTVANIGFEAGVADVAFHRDANVGLTVANIGFEAGVAEAAFRTVDVADVAFRVTDVADAGFGHVEAGEPHDATKEPFPPDAQLTVANVGFDATTGKPRDAGDAG